MLNAQQVGAVLERLAYIVVPLLVTHGYVAAEDSQQITSFILAGIATAVGIWNNRAKRLTERAAKLPGTTIVAPDDIANKVSASNVVSSSTNRVEHK